MKWLTGLHIADWVIAGVFFIGSMWVLTPVYDDYGYFILSMAAGQYSDFSFLDLHYLGFIGVNHIYKFLYTSMPAYAWMAWVLLLSNFVGLGLLLHTVRRVLWNKERPLWLLRTVQVAFAFFYLENFWILSHTRFALLFCGLALLNLAFADTLKKRDTLVCTAVFLWGLLHRPEGGLGMLLLVSAGFLIYRFRPVFLFKRVFFPLAATGLLFTGITVNRLQTDIYVRRVEPEIEYKLMDKHVRPVSGQQTPADSVKYQAALTGMWFDTATMSPEYLRSILLPGINTVPAHAIKVGQHVGAFYGRYAFIPVWALLCVLWAAAQKKVRVLLLFLLWQVTTFGIVYALDFNGLLVEGRHFLNLQLVSVALSLVYTRALPLPQKPVWAVLAGIGMAAGSCMAVYHYALLNRMVGQSVACYETFMQEAENTYQKRIVVITLDNYNLLDRSFSLRNRNYTKNTYILYDMFTFSLIPEYMDYLNRLCGCRASDPEAFYAWLARREALYMAKPPRYALTERFMYVIHKQRLHFVADNTLSDLPCTKQSHKKNFEWRKVVLETP